MNYMLRAVELARRGVGFVSPNPLVGAVLVKDGRVIGEGWHRKYGDLHAEREALKNATESPENAELYVTLEPCCHQGKQPPCTEAIVSAKIRKVYIGSRDPNDLVSGKGVQYLREHGIEVVCDVEREACDRLNPIFFHFIQKKTPYIMMKYAMTLDGKIATRTGMSKWITGDEARKAVHQDRHRYTGIMVGIGTVLEDDPMLNTRIENGKDPIRIICDSRLQIPLDSHIVETAREIPSIIAYGRGRADREKIEALRERACELIEVSVKEGHLDLKELVQILGERGIDSILLEGGARLNEAMLREGLVHYVKAYIAPKIFGGEQAKTPVSGMGVENPSQAFRLEKMEISKIGEDFLIEGEVI